MKLPWSDNWGTTYRITFGTRTYTKTLVPPSIVSLEYSKPEDNQVTIPSNAISKDNLEDPRGFDFSFESKQMATSSGSETEDSYLILTNLNEDEKKILFQPNCVVMVEAGFEGKLTLCYTGDVVDIDTIRKPPDIQYKIKLKAEGIAVRDTMIHSHYDESLSEQDIIIDMVGRFSGMSLGTYGLEESKDRYKTGGKGFTGSLVTNFDKVMAKNNLQYTVTNGKIVIIPFKFRSEDYNKFARTNFNIPSDSIKMITDVSDNKGLSGNSVQNKLKTIQVNTFYMPVEVGQFITIQDSDYTSEFKGTYIVKGRRVILKSMGNAWDVVLQCEAVNL